MHISQIVTEELHWHYLYSHWQSCSLSCHHHPARTSKSSKVEIELALVIDGVTITVFIIKAEVPPVE